MAKIMPTRAPGPARTIRTAPGKNKSSGKAKGKGHAVISPSKGSGKGQGQWVWMPQAAALPAPVHYGIPMRQMPYGSPYSVPMRPAAFGRKGKGGAPQAVPFAGKMGGKMGKRAGKGGAQFLVTQQPLSKAEKQKQQLREKLRKVDASKRVWVGNMSKKTTWRELQKHFSDIAKPTVVDVNEKKGTGVVCFETEEDASSAIAVLNGSELGGEVIEVDVWTKPAREPKEPKEPKAEGEGSEKKKKVKKVSLKQSAAKKEKQKLKMAERLQEIDHSLKVWVGGLSPDTTWIALSEHMTPVAKPKLVNIMGKGKAVVAFDDIAHVEEAISSFNDTELDGKTIKVDEWKKPERMKKEKSD